MKEEDIMNKLETIEKQITNLALLIIGISATIVVLIGLTACTKLPEPQEKVNNCYDCIIKQDKIEAYRAVYCCTEAELQSIISNEASKGTTIKCKKQ